MHGTFINPNHFAGYLEIGLAFSFVLLWTEISRSGRRTQEEDTGQCLSAG